ncbi:hypothetical protein H8N01_17790 [Streptomyces sp. AC536]|uniref:DUF6262 family protein n=1 Tax=Streptomyces buecherae TaxID=2763006 RepID=UPI00164D1622|nr:DUF6262 family protein [Streptomyces buecherae]MBC3984369.1 hypothetical protein [Streptomyces buecherae]QNJ39809.1 hypothetical protein H7H31_07885 [Streptomyces buecherae]
MTTTVPAARTSNALEARRRKTQAALERIQAVLEQLAGAKRPITMAAVARQADVSRTFLYEHAEARALVAEAVSRAAGRRVQDRRAESEAIEASWRERALNAEEALKAAHDEIRTQRERIGDLLGQVKDLQTQWSEEDIVRVTTDNANLTRRARRLAAENKSLTDKLAAARDNVRFADKRIADLEVQLTERELS